MPGSPPPVVDLPAEMPSPVSVQSGTTRSQPSEIDANRLEHQAEHVDLLDVVDSQVGTATYLANISNSIALPNLPFLTRKPVVDLAPPAPSAAVEPPTPAESTAGSTAFTAPTLPSASSSEEQLDQHLQAIAETKRTKKEIAAQVWKGFVAFAKTPSGVFFVAYGFLVVFWGAALVLILARAIPMPSDYRRNVWVEICSQILWVLKLIFLTFNWSTNEFNG